MSDPTAPLTLSQALAETQRLAPFLRALGNLPGILDAMAAQEGLTGERQRRLDSLLEQVTDVDQKLTAKAAELAALTSKGETILARAKEAANAAMEDARENVKAATLEANKLRGDAEEYANKLKADSNQLRVDLARAREEHEAIVAKIKAVKDAARAQLES